MKSLESLEKGTPEFQTLSENQQEQRRRFFTVTLISIVNGASSLGITPQDAYGFICDLLEFHLTGRVEKLPDKTKK